jgi:uncharacterized repeat protein (TIGR01451 family)
MFKSKILSLVFLLSSAVFVSNTYAAAPSAGSVIGNQATANYTDGSGQTKVATSNLVETTVAKIAGVTITANQSKTVSVGGTVLFQHTITNTGNGVDSFNLILTDDDVGNINFNNLVVYADADKNGVPDGSAILSTPSLASGSSYGILVSGTVPSSANNADSEQLTILVRSAFNNTIQQSNQDTVSVTGNAVVDVVKSLSLTTGPSPSSSPITVTLTYTNTGDSSASSVVFNDPLPTGMSYVASSGSWSGFGGGLTDASDGDESGSTTGIDYFVAGNNISANVANIPSGSSGTISFQVTIDSSVVPGNITNTANTTYDDGSGTTIGPINTNGSAYTVQQTASVEMNDNGSASDEDGDNNNDIVAITTPVSQGQTVVFENNIVNNGNGDDTFEIRVLTGASNTFPSGTVFQFFKADGATPLSDTNSDGNPDTGVITPLIDTKIVVKAILPSGFSGSDGYQFLTEGRSKFTNSVFNTVTNTLTAITSSTVDVTMNFDSGTATASDGLGAGIEVNPVVSESVLPNGTASFSMFVNNTSGLPDTYSLQASTDPTFATITLPSDWNVVFRDGGSSTSTTGSIPASGNKNFTVDVSVADGAPVTQAIYFRAVSSVTNAVDTIYNEVVIQQVEDISLTPNNTGQIFPAGTNNYTHSINNNGNVTSTSGAITVGNSITGFNAIVYLDLNNDGFLDSGDPVINDISDIAGGINAKSSVTLIVKVFAPSGAGEGTANTTSITISPSAGEINTSDNTASDVSTVISGDVTLTKRQGLDSDCNGTVDGSFTSAQISNALPGACVVYEIVGTNTGSAGITSLFLNDTTPNFTTYFDCLGGCSASSSVGVTTPPANGSNGTVVVNVGNLTPSSSVTLIFVVKIDE